jgi:hypothetical protein
MASRGQIELSKFIETPCTWKVHGGVEFFRRFVMTTQNGIMKGGRASASRSLRLRGVFGQARAA